MNTDETTIEHRILAFAREAAQRRLGDHAEIDGDTPLLEIGVIDSLAVFEIVAMLEEAFGISVPSTELVPSNFASVRALTGLVGRLSEPMARVS